jgi:hypothetical protein
MSVESSRSFILWAVPRFRRSHAIVRYALNIEAVRPVPVASRAVSRESETLGGPVRNAAGDRDNPEVTACPPAHLCAYH